MMGTPPALRELLDLDSLEDTNVFIVGLGGIGSPLSKLIAMFLNSINKPVTLYLVDGDKFEDKNAERMEVTDIGNKADIVAKNLDELLSPEVLDIVPIVQYIDETNVSKIIREGDIVLSCVDNHATRKVLSDRCEELKDITFISGGNDGYEGENSGTYGNVQVHRKKNGEDLNPAITKFHPEIANPTDEIPTVSCQQLAETSAPQIIFVNHLAASMMGAAFFRTLHKETDMVYDENCFDVLEGIASPRTY